MTVSMVIKFKELFFCINLIKSNKYLFTSMSIFCLHDLVLLDYHIHFLELLEVFIHVFTVVLF